MTHVTFGELMQAFATELLIARDSAQDDSDRAIVAAYAEVLETYKDSSAIWKQANESAREDWMKGRTFLTEVLEPIASKYKLPVRQERLGGTEHTYSSLDPDAMQKVWVVAEEKGKKAYELYVRPSGN